MSRWPEHVRQGLVCRVVARGLGNRAQLLWKEEEVLGNLLDLVGVDGALHLLLAAVDVRGRKLLLKRVVESCEKASLCCVYTQQIIAYACQGRYQWRH